MAKCHEPAQPGHITARYYNVQLATSFPITGLLDEWNESFAVTFATVTAVTLDGGSTMARAVRFSVASMRLALVALPGLAVSSAAHPPRMEVLVNCAPPIKKSQLRAVSADLRRGPHTTGCAKHGKLTG